MLSSAVKTISSTIRTVVLSYIADRIAEDRIANCRGAHLFVFVALLMFWLSGPRGQIKDRIIAPAQLCLSPLCCFCCWSCLFRTLMCQSTAGMVTQRASEYTFLSWFNIQFPYIIKTHQQLAIFLDFLRLIYKKWQCRTMSLSVPSKRKACSVNSDL